MADILPFRGIHYNTDAIGGDLSAVAAPPYDVISPEEQAALYERSPHNVVRLILGRETDRYARAAALFREWRAGDVLVSDEDPSLYVYHQTFADPTTGKTAPERMGLICLLRLEDYASGGVLPHENTLTAAKADRLELLRATHAQFESIYGLYSDPDRAVQSFIDEYDDREPVLERVDDMIGSSHCIERIADPNAATVLREMLRDEPIFIADGHHRYETALNYRREWRAAHPEISEDTPVAADYILITLTAFEDEGLLVLPTHRLVKGVDPDRIAALPRSLTPHFTVTDAAPDALEAAIAKEAQLGRAAFGLVLPAGSCLATLTVADADIPALVPGGQSPAAKRLPVTLLQSLILDQRLGVDAAALAAGDRVAYTRDAAEAVRRVRDGEYQAALLLGRPSAEDVRAVSLAGDKMPQKSTFFFPKLLSGLILRDLSLDDPAEMV
ncbi:MAG: DUF1015 domain-containing protein [Armatimonadetes bacterium]|nr:DUF1015 domain-containing protein [Armatimonadota bacterium]